MDDLDDVRAALGYEHINLFGTSYGTRAAQVYLRRYPSRVRSITLKGSTFIGDSVVTSIARDAQRALDIVFDDCVKDESCHNAFPNLKQEFTAVLDRFKMGVIKVEVADANTGKKEQVELSRGAFATTLRSLLQSAGATARVPMLIHQAFENNFTPYVQMIKALRSAYSNGAVSIGMFLAVINSEDLPLTEQKKVEQESAGTFMGDYYYQQLARACRNLPRGKVPRGYYSPVRSNVPVLLISGFRDPATPPHNADAIAQYLSNSVHIVVRYGGHSYQGFGPCVDDLMADFISRGATKGLDTSCVSQLRQTPFYVEKAELGN